MKLISMTDFVLKQNYTTTLDISQVDFYDKELSILKKIRNYANFLKQPLKLEMFVPCDEDGNVLNKPDLIEERYSLKLLDYEEAKEKVLFEGFENYFFELKEYDVFVLNEKTFSTKDLVENLLEYKGLEFNLTPNAIKQIEK